MRKSSTERNDYLETESGLRAAVGNSFWNQDFSLEYSAIIVSTVTTTGTARSAPSIPDNFAPIRRAIIVTKGGNPTTVFITKGTIR